MTNGVYSQQHLKSPGARQSKRSLHKYIEVCGDLSQAAHPVLPQLTFLRYFYTLHMKEGMGQV